MAYIPVFIFLGILIILSIMVFFKRYLMKKGRFLNENDINQSFFVIFRSKFIKIDKDSLLIPFIASVLVISLIFLYSWIYFIASYDIFVSDVFITFFVVLWLVSFFFISVLIKKGFVTLSREEEVDIGGESMSNKLKSLALIIVSILLVSTNAIAKDKTLSEAEKLIEGGNSVAAAEMLRAYVQGDGSNNPDALVLYGKALELMTESINTDAEMKCYRSPGAPKTPKCMHQYAESLNAKYGAGSFEYVHNIITIKYTGQQYRDVGARFPKSKAAAAAEYNELTKNLIGHPSVVLPRIQAFLDKHPKGEWNRKGQLLWARINEDIWWVHKNWAWMLYNWEISQDELLVKGEAYRQEAMKGFKKVRGGAEGKAAKKELKLLKAYKTDGKMYGIINESSISGFKVNGVSQ